MAPHEPRTEPMSAGAHDSRKKQARPKNPAPCLNCSLSKVRVSGSRSLTLPLPSILRLNYAHRWPSIYPVHRQRRFTRILRTVQEARERLRASCSILKEVTIHHEGTSIQPCYNCCLCSLFQFRQERQQSTSPTHVMQQQMYHYWLDPNAAAGCTLPDYSSYSSYHPYSTSQLEPTLTYNMGQEQSYAYGYLTPPQFLDNQWQQPVSTS